MSKKSAIRLSTAAPIMILAASVGLLGGCGGDGYDLIGPEVGLDSPVSARASAGTRSTQQATDIQFGDFALHVPANVHHVRGIIVALGGPDTRGFAVGTPFGAPFPPVEAALQELGAMFRGLAAERGLAILGSGRFGPMAYPNEPASDQLLLEAIARAATLIGRPDLLDAPLLLYGVSGGGPEATGFTQRNPDRVAALFLKVPQTAGPLTGEALRVPAYVILAELDAFVDNTLLRETFEAHRAAGAPWAMALEPGVPHHALSPAQRELTVGWMRAILPLVTPGAFLQTPPHVGWLGDPVTCEIAPARSFTGDKSVASWFPRQPLAEEWAGFIGCETNRADGGQDG